MLLSRWTQRFYDSTRGRIIILLRRASLTVDQIAGSLGLTDNAVRAHLVTLERDGMVEQRVAKRGGVGKPAYMYRITAEADRLFSRAYIPILGRLLDVLTERMSPQELETVMQAVGHRLATEQPISGGSARQRTEEAAKLLNDLGGITEVEERDGALRIHGFSCPLGAAVRGHPEVCAAVETMLSEIIGAPVHERCNRDGGERPSCCFDVATITNESAPSSR